MQVQYNPNQNLEPQLKKMVQLTKDTMKTYGYLGKAYTIPLSPLKLTDFSKYILFQCMQHIRRDSDD